MDGAISTPSIRFKNIELNNYKVQEVSSRQITSEISDI